MSAEFKEAKIETNGYEGRILDTDMRNKDVTFGDLNKYLRENSFVMR